MTRPLPPDPVPPSWGLLRRRCAPKSTRWSHRVAAAMLMLGAGSAAAQSFACGYQGRLISLGSDAAAGASLWLSLITTSYSADRYSLLAPAPAGAPDPAIVVDNWAGAGPRLSVSPVVATGLGGAHALVANLREQPCLIDVATLRVGIDNGLPPAGGGGGSGGGIGGGGGSGGSGGGVGGGGAGGGDVGLVIRSTQSGLAQLGMQRANSISDRIVDGMSLRTRGGRRGSAVSPSNAAEAAPAPSQVWVEARGFDREDDSGALAGNAHLYQTLVGADTLVRPGLLIGIALAADRGRAESLRGFARTEGTTTWLGPYLGADVGDWVIDAWAAYGAGQPRLSLGPLAGDTDTQGLLGSLNATGQTALGATSLLYKLGVDYSTQRTDAFNYTGTVNGRGWIVRTPQVTSAWGDARASMEFSHAWQIGGNEARPYGRVGVRYAFLRPDGLALPNIDEPSRWSGSLEGGVLAALGKHTLLEASAGYWSLGQSGIDTWGVRLALAWRL